MGLNDRVPRSGVFARGRPFHSGHLAPRVTAAGSRRSALDPALHKATEAASSIMVSSQCVLGCGPQTTPYSHGASDPDFAAEIHRWDGPSRGLRCQAWSHAPMFGDRLVKRKCYINPRHPQGDHCPHLGADTNHLPPRLCHFSVFTGRASSKASAGDAGTLSSP